MWQATVTFLESLFVGPMWPASVLLALLVIYCLMAIIGLADLDLDAPDVDIDASDAASSMDLGDTVGGMGAATLRWLNLQNVPLVVWTGIFAILWWIVSWTLWTGFDHDRYAPTLLTSVLLAARNFVIAVGLTKLTTGPLAKRFETSRYRPATLMGQTCQVCSGEATPEFGQARFRTDAAPLLLNIRTDGAHLNKGDLVRIVSFDPERRIYTVTKADIEVQA